MMAHFGLRYACTSLSLNNPLPVSSFRTNTDQHAESGAPTAVLVILAFRLRSYIAALIVNAISAQNTNAPQRQRRCSLLFKHPGGGQSGVGPRAATSF